MRNVATIPARDREALFRNTAAKMGVSEAIIEKDFWVCYMLDYLFHRCAWKDNLAFKGGTSLSKAYGLIERFSEDIDLILDWRVLGYGINEPWEERSNTKQDIFNKEANTRAEEFLRDTFLPAVSADLTAELGDGVKCFIDPDDAQTVKISDVKMPASKLEILVKMLRKQIKEYSKTNQMAAKKFQEMLEETIRQYHERRKHLTAEEAGEAQEHATEDIIRNATEHALEILKNMNADRESFRKIGLTFEEKAFYDILMALRNEYNFEYGTDKKVDGIMVNDKCKALAKKIKEIIDTKSSFADWLNNQIVRDQLKFDIKVCLIKNGYPPQYSPEVFRKVMEQVENFEENN